MSRLILLGVLLGVIVFAWIGWRDRSPDTQPKEMAAPVIVKQPANYAKRTFDPAGPPSDMPPLSGAETAECVSDFLSNASVSGQTWRTDPTHATVTVTQVRVTLQLNVTIWTPAGATPHVLEHEEGHRRISEYYYQSADQVAARIAANYMGKQIEITGEDLTAEAHNALQQMGAEITDEYDKELNPNPTQLLYDSITDHARNEVVAEDAVAHALKNAAVEANSPAGADPPDHQ